MCTNMHISSHISEGICITIREALAEDLDAILNLFVESIEATCSVDYSPAQIKAWTASVQDRSKWFDRLTKQYFVVAEALGYLLGFASMENDNYVDLMYVNHKFQGQGVAKGLLHHLLECTTESKITTHASITAKPFFERNGFKVVKENRFELRGVEIVNFEMQLVVN